MVSVLGVHHLTLLLKLSNFLTEVIVIGQCDTRVSLTSAGDLVRASAAGRNNGILMPMIKIKSG
jgi:hypothetical protein